jgi:hypothetical protein
MLPLAFMAQHVWEVGAAVLALVIIIQALTLLIRGSNTPEASGMDRRTVRVLGALMLLLGVGIAFAAFLVDAEEPGAHAHDHWGGAVGVAFLCVWVALIIGVSVWQARSVKPPRR